MFNVDDKVVYPGHGVAKINRIIQKFIGGQNNTFYELKLLNKDMTVLVPVSHSHSAGIRPLSSDENIEDIFKFLTEPAKKIAHHEILINNWNKRHKEYQIKIRGGDPKDIAEIYRDLKHIAQHKELSFGEKNLLSQTELLLAEEIAVVRHLEEDKAIEQLRAPFQAKINVGYTVM